MNQNSFGFKILDDDWDTDDGKRVRTLNQVKLYDISPVTYPAYPQTEIHIRGRWGETTLVYDNLKNGTKQTIANIVRANEKARVKEIVTQYGISERLYSISKPEPEIFLTDKEGEMDGKESAKKSFVQPKPLTESEKKIRDRISKYINRRN